jgi:hypothetical protein
MTFSAWPDPTPRRRPSSPPELRCCDAAPGTVAHAVADEGDTMRSIAEVIGRRLDLPAEAVPAENVGFLGHIFAVDQPSSSALTRERFGWEPTHPSLLDHLDAGNYPP